jgi:two-component system, cell cycle sensor histidine kinase and response regulator CckA
MERGQGSHQAAKGGGGTEPRRVLQPELLRSMLDATRDLIYAKDGDGLYLACNEASERLVGLPEAAQIGKMDRDFFPPEFAQAVLAEDRAIMATGQERRVEEWVTYPDGTAVLLESVKTAFYDPDGKVAGIVGVSRDITLRHRAEVEQKWLQAEVAHFQRLESLGQLAGGVAHEINNVLASIMAASEVLLMSGGEAAPLAELILQSTRHGRDIVRDLVDFSRKDLTATALLDLNEVVRHHAQLLSSTTRQKIQILEVLEEGLPLILAEAAALSSAVLNLCLNAVDAMPEGGTLTLRTLKTSAGMAQLCVEDTGQGMTEQVRLRAMEPFFTTKPFGKGAGLGLSRVFGLVQAHGGTIEIESHPGVGTRVLLAFPAAAEPDLALPGLAVPSAAAPAKIRRVLLVDDDALVRESIPILLESMGHQVEVASGGAEALRRLATGAAVDCVILDLNMPGMTGEETLQRLREALPGLPVIIGSGEMDPERSEHLLALPAVTMLPKPYGLLDLEAVLRQLD